MTVFRKTQDALTLLEKHMRYSHQVSVIGAHQSDGSSEPLPQQRPVISPDNLNVNEGVQGANFFNSPFHNNTFNIHLPTTDDTDPAKKLLFNGEEKKVDGTSKPQPPLSSHP